MIRSLRKLSSIFWKRRPRIDQQQKRRFCVPYSIHPQHRFLAYTYHQALRVIRDGYQCMLTGAFDVCSIERGPISAWPIVPFRPRSPRQPTSFLNPQMLAYQVLPKMVRMYVYVHIFRVDRMIYS